MFSGCTSDSNEIDDQVYVLAIGTDRGVDNKLRLTVQYPTYKGGGGGGGGTEMSGGGSGGGDKESGEVSGTIVETVEASSILEGINLLNTSTTRRLSLVHIKMIVFSEDFARAGIGNYLEPLARFRETRRIAQVVVCRGSAEDFIKENKTLIGGSVSKALELMVTESANTGFFPHTPFHNFYKEILSSYEQAYAAYAGVNDFKKLKPLSNSDRAPLKTQFEVLPGEEPRKGDLKNEYFGTAIFDGAKMVGSLNSYETRYLLLVKGEYQKGIMTIEDSEKPGAAIPLDIRLGRKPKIKVTFENGTPLIDIKLNIEADIGAIQSRTPYEKLSKINDLNKQIENTIQDGVKKMIEKTQKEWGSDVMAFGRFAARNFFTIQEFEDYNWIEHYRDAKVTVEVEANVRRTGLMFSASPIKNSKQKIKSTGE